VGVAEEGEEKAAEAALKIAGDLQAICKERSSFVNETLGKELDALSMRRQKIALVVADRRKERLATEALPTELLDELSKDRSGQRFLTKLSVFIEGFPHAAIARDLRLTAAEAKVILGVTEWGELGRGWGASWWTNSPAAKEIRKVACNRLLESPHP